MELKAGQRLVSVVSDVQVVVVKAPAGPVDLRCGGAPMVPDGEYTATDATLDESLGDGPLLGKRYADEEAGLELLCSKAGPGALQLNGALLEIKGAKPLPSSD